MQQCFEANRERGQEVERLPSHRNQFPCEVHPIELGSFADLESGPFESCDEIAIAEAIQDFVIVPAWLQGSSQSHQRTVVDGFDDKEKATGDEESEAFV